MQTRVSVQTSARLHLGFFDLNGSLGRRFGSFGLALDRPVTTLTIFRAPELTLGGPDADRVGAHIEALRSHLHLDAAYGVRVEQAVPAHAGLGSGTQLAFALAAGLRRLEGLPQDIAGDALLLQRGARSGIGAALFSRGGFVVDGGHGPRKSPAARCEPSAVPRRLADHSRHGQQTLQASTVLRNARPLRRCRNFSAAASADICHRLLMQALPALVERDLAQFGGAVSHIQATLAIISLLPRAGRVTPAATVGRSCRRLEHFGATRCRSEFLGADRLCLRRQRR